LVSLQLIPSFSEALQFFWYEVNNYLFYFAIDNYNSTFLKYAFKNHYFRRELLEKKKVIEHILDSLEEGVRTELYFRMLAFANFTKWHHLYIKRLIGVIKQTIMQDYEVNRILLAINPILFICLCCEYLTMIGKSIHIFRHECQLIKIRLLGFGRKIIENMD